MSEYTRIAERARARLNAAAPDLLALAELVAKSAPHQAGCYVRPDMDSCTCHVKQARIAIAKARGSL